MSFQRRLPLESLVAKNSFFLFGPRATGKSTLIHATLPSSIKYDLLSPSVYARLLADPSILDQELSVAAPRSLVVIDEIQKIPALLDVVHKLIEGKGLRFLLTGSSARKLRRTNMVNMLGGRAWEAHLFPLVSAEIPDFDLMRYLNRGGLPRAYLSEDYLEEHRAYAGIYLKEEILAEALVRRLDLFSRFLQVAAVNSGEELHFEGIASDAQVKAKTVGNYIEILEDTLLAYRLPAFWKTKKRKAISRAKFFLFDVGLAGHLAKRGVVEPGSLGFGKAFEHFIINEIRAYLSYNRKGLEIFYWRSTSGQEVDLIIDDELAIEIKATNHVGLKHLQGLKAFNEEKLVKRSIVVSCDERERVLQGVHIMPWRQFLSELWGGALV